MSDFEGKVPVIKIAECKHQIKFLDILFTVFKYITKCEMIVTGLKYNKFYFEHFFTALSSKERK